MKQAHFVSIIPLLVMVMLAMACNQPDKLSGSQEPKTPESLNNVIMPEGFSYDNYVEVEMVVQFFDDFNRVLKNQVFEVYSAERQLIVTATTNEFGRYAGKLNLPKVSSELIIRASRIGLVNDEWNVPVTGTTLNIAIKY